MSNNPKAIASLEILQGLELIGIHNVTLLASDLRTGESLERLKLEHIGNALEALREPVAARMPATRTMQQVAPPPFDLESKRATS
jgi:hypothetical protein